MSNAISYSIGMTLICGYVLSAHVSYGAYQHEPSAQDIINMAPSFSNTGPESLSFHVSGYYGGPAGFNFDVARQGRTHLSVRMTDHADGTPYLIGVDGHVLVYDAVHYRVVSGTVPGGIWFTAKATPDNKGLQVHGGYAQGSPNSIQIDLKSIIMATNLSHFTSQKAENALIILTGHTRHGGTVTAYVDTRQKCPYVRMELRSKEADVQPIVSFSTIQEDMPIPSQIWTPPDSKALSANLGASLADLHHWTPDAEGVIGLSMWYRSAIRDDGALRKEWERRFGAVDWMRAEQKDRATTTALRRAVKIDVPAVEGDLKR